MRREDEYRGSCPSGEEWCDYCGTYGCSGDHARQRPDKHSDDMDYWRRFNRAWDRTHKPGKETR